jgi:hypothetical protein
MSLLSFGRGNLFPFTFGSGDSDLASLHETLLDAYAPGWDVDDSTSKAAEAYMHALAVTFLWTASRRGANQGQSLKMLEYLPVWEEACRLRPTALDRPTDRRSTLAAHLRGLTDNTLAGIEAVARSLLGVAFVAVLTTDPAQEITYWPGQYPGPPGYEWSSNRLALAVQYTPALLDPADTPRVLGALERSLDNVVPAWMTFTVSGAGGFILGLSQLGSDGL